MPTVLWPNGDMHSAPTWGKLLRQLRKTQWHRWTPWGFRREMGRRAELWSGERINTHGSAEQLFRELERVGALRVIDDD